MASNAPALQGETRTHTIPGGHGFAFFVPAGAHFRIIDLHGQQVVDLMAWSAPYSASTTCEHFSASYTQHNLGSAANPSESQALFSNRDRKMFEVVTDMVKTHDMQYMACNPSMYQRLGKAGHRSCASNMAEAMTQYLRETGESTVKFEWYQVHDPFNIFQNTPYYTMKGGMNASRKDDYIELKALMDTVVSLSACPYEEEGFNGGRTTDVEVYWQTHV